MTREEAIKWIKEHAIDHIDAFTTKSELKDAEEAQLMAIEALEQEPILDKIRAEIESLSNANPSYWYSGDMVDRDDVLDIIDKYKAESEVE